MLRTSNPPDWKACRRRKCLFRAARRLKVARYLEVEPVLAAVSKRMRWKWFLPEADPGPMTFPLQSQQESRTNHTRPEDVLQTPSRFCFQIIRDLFGGALMSHGINENVDEHRVSHRFGKRVEITVVIRFVLPAIAEMIVVADDNHHALLAIINGVVVRTMVFFDIRPAAVVGLAGA